LEGGRPAMNLRKGKKRSWGRDKSEKKKVFRPQAGKARFKTPDTAGGEDCSPGQRKPWLGARPGGKQKKKGFRENIEGKEGRQPGQGEEDGCDRKKTAEKKRRGKVETRQFLTRRVMEGYEKKQRSGQH